MGFALRAVGAAVRLRRKARGPMRPSWDERFETWATVLHYYAKRSYLLPLALQRRAAALAVSSRRSSTMRYEKVDANGVPAEWFRGNGFDDERVILYLHGGGYSIGSIDVHREPVSRLCLAAGVRAFVIDYRLAPEHPFPAQLEDAVTAYRWLLARGIDAAHIVVAGESAGAALTLSTLVALRDANVPLPAAALCVSPWVDLEMRGASMITNEPYDYLSRELLQDYVRRFVKSGDVRNPLAAPIHADLHGLPPLLVLAGGAEVLLDDARDLVFRAKKAGVEVTLEVEPDMIHVWPLFGSAFARSQASIERMADFVRLHLPDGATNASTAAK